MPDLDGHALLGRVQLTIRAGSATSDVNEVITGRVIDAHAHYLAVLERPFIKDLLVEVIHVAPTILVYRLAISRIGMSLARAVGAECWIPPAATRTSVGTCYGALAIKGAKTRPPSK
jgi:hypothetical protein